jgi:hypothetical protein
VHEPTLRPANAGTNPQSIAILAQNKVVEGKKIPTTRAGNHLVENQAKKVSAREELSG